MARKPRKPPVGRPRRAAPVAKVPAPFPVILRKILLAPILLPMMAGLLEDLLRRQQMVSFAFLEWLALLVLLMLPLVLRLSLRVYRRHRWRRVCLAAIRTAFLQHADKLALNRARLVQADDYGVEDTDRWHAHLDRFVR